MVDGASFGGILRGEKTQCLRIALKTRNLYSQLESILLGMETYVPNKWHIFQICKNEDGSGNP
jgi:hypothetical protein